MTSIQPELRVDHGAEAVTFYQAAFGATVLHRVGDGEDIVAQLAIGDARSGSPRQAQPASASTPRRSAARPAAPSSSSMTPRRSSTTRSPQVPPPPPPWQTNTAGGLPGSQTHSAINGKSGAPSAPGRHPHPNHHRQLAYASAGSRSSACRSPGSAPPADGGASAFIAEQIGESGTSSSQGL